MERRACASDTLA